MPPPLPSLLKTGIDVLQAAHKTASDFFVGTQLPDNSHVANPSCDVEPDSESVFTETSTKRSRGSSSGLHGKQTWRKVVLSSDEKRLWPDHREPPPKDFTPILVPAKQPHYRADQDWKPNHLAENKSRSMGGPKVTGGFRPQNTLNQPTKQAASSQRSGTFFSNYDNHKAAKTTTTRALATQRTRGANVPCRRTLSDQGRNSSSSPKRRRLDLFSFSIDLTEDDDQVDPATGSAVPRSELLASNTRRSSTQSRESERKKRESDGFGNSQLSEMDRSMGIIKRRKFLKKDRRHASANVSRSPSQNANEIRGSNGSSLQNPAAVSVDNEDEVAFQHSSNVGNARPVINLEIGMGETEENYRLQQKRRNGEGSTAGRPHTDVLVQAVQKPDDSSVKRPKESPHIKRETEKSTDQLVDAARPLIERSLGKSGRLGETFKRDESEVVEIASKRLKASQRMQIESHIVQAGYSSPDELQSGYDIRRRQSMSIPLKRTKDPRFEQLIVKETRQAESTRRQQPAPTKVQHAQQSSENIEDDGNSNLILLKAIFMKGYCADQKDLSLSLDESIPAFLLFSGSISAKTVTGDGIVIGKAAVSHLWIASDESTKVVLKGSVDELSNGAVLLEFETRRGKQQCFETMQALTKGTLQCSLKNNAALEKLFKRQSEDLLKINATWSVKVVKDLETVPRQDTDLLDDGSIKYEPVDETVASGALRQQTRQRPQQVNPRHADGSTSRFFSQPTTRRSDRLPNATQQKRRSASPEKWTQAHKPEPWPRPVVYPPEGARRVTVEFHDLERLDDGEFLNDNIINYALRKLEQTMAVEHRNKVHFFNTFFFSSLSMKNGRKAFNYDMVKRWTKTVDLLTKPYVVVPINLNLHWFLAIICNMDKISRKTNKFDDLDLRSNSQQMSPPPGENDFGEDGGPRPEQQVKHQLDDLSLDDDNVNVGLNSGFNNAAGKRKKKPPPLKKHDIDVPLIMSLDSFGTGRSNELGILKQYVCAEAKERRGIDMERSEIQGMTAKDIPLQPNFHDCGVYLLGYVEAFAKDPEKFVNSILQRNMDDAVFKNFNASRKRAEVREELLEQAEEARKTHVTQNKAKRAAQTPLKSQKGSAKSDSATPGERSPSELPQSSRRWQASSSASESESARPSALAQGSSYPKYLDNPYTAFAPAKASTTLNEHNAPPLSVANNNSAGFENGHDNERDSQLEVDAPAYLGQVQEQRALSEESSLPDDRPFVNEDDEMLLDLEYQGIPDSQPEPAAT